jgi:glycosyltransferase involved in cell wall biosynthesis
VTPAAPDPELSVVIPARQSAGTIGRAVASVLAQDLAGLEVIVVDDGSTDGTRGAVEAVADPRVRYRHQEHRGVSAARNHGASLARGRFLAFLDSDDEALPGWAAALAGGLADPSVGVVCCGLEIRRDGRAEVLLPRPRGPEFAEQTVEFLAGSFAVRGEVFEAVGGYREELSFSENTELGFRLVFHCLERGLRLAAVMAPLVRYHAPAGQPRQAVEERLAASEYILEHHAATLRRNPTIHARLLATAGVRAARLGRYPRARSLFREALRSDPAEWRNYPRLLAALVPPLAARVWGPPAGAATAGRRG